MTRAEALEYAQRWQSNYVYALQAAERMGLSGVPLTEHARREATRMTR